jgi:uncharacterized protein (DUF1501 family)
VPYLVLGQVAFSGPLASIAGRVGATNQVVALLDGKKAYPAAPGARFGGAKDGAAPFPSGVEDALIRDYLAASAARERATRGQRGYNRTRVDDFTASFDRGERLRSFATGFGERGLTRGLDDQAKLALDALSQGVSQTAMLSSGSAWDSHSNNAMQSDYNQTLFSGLRTLADGLSARVGRRTGGKMIDETVVVVLSEMGRTPKLNKDQGKDHWPVTSALVFGAGVNGGRVFGGTTDQLEARNVDFQSGAATDGGKQLQTPNLMAALLTLVGVDPAPYLPKAEVFHALIA